MKYFLECPICDLTTTLEIHYDDEDRPSCCAMCGMDAEYTTKEKNSGSQWEDEIDE